MHFVLAAPTATHDRIDYLDSIRGLAALYVVLFHAGLDLDRTHLPLPLRAASAILGDGKLAVALFIVLSGYCLMLPVARSASFAPRLSFREYIARRAWRIYPSYLVALLLSIGCLLLLDPAVRSRAHWLDTFAGPITWRNLAAHLVLAHNLSEHWIFKINAPFWSVATEWQIYFFFPLLLALVRRTNFVVAIASAFAVSMLPMLAFHRFETAAPWFLGLFAMGMAAANVAHSPADTYRRLRQGRWWLAAALPCWGTTFVFSQPSFERFGWKKFACEQGCWGAGVSVFLIWLATVTRGAEFTKRLLHWKPLVALGRMSYSLYLTHAFVVSGVVIFLSFTLPDASPGLRWSVATAAGGCLSVAFARIFYLLCERPFMNTRRLAAAGPADLSAARSHPV